MRKQFTFWGGLVLNALFFVAVASLSAAVVTTEDMEPETRRCLISELQSR